MIKQFIGWRIALSALAVWLCAMSCSFAAAPVIGTRDINFVNNCSFPVWFGFSSGASDRRGGGAGCNSDADCYDGSMCVDRGTGGKQCFWKIPQPANGNHRLEANGGRNLVSIPIYQGNGFAFSGGVAGRTNCVGAHCETADCGNGGGACPAGRGFEAPSTSAEFTLSSVQGVDFYDVTVINGFNVPMVMAANTNGTAPYECGAPGAVQPTTGVGSCSWNMAPPLMEYRWVRSGGNLCSSDANCGSGSVCGLSDNPGQSPRFKKSCGKLLGYWTANEICGRDGNYGAPFNCGMRLPEQPQFTMWNLLACAPIGSCYQNGASNKCCGCVNWDKIGLPVPASTEQCKNSNPTWTTYVQPTLTWLKRACPTAYTYPYDDMSSTFTCRRDQGGINRVGYTVTFCPNGLTGGVTG